jgi:ABC-type lipoprotein release transport system permease subunit
VLVGSGVVAGNFVLLLVVMLASELNAEIVGALATTSALMLTVGLLACVEPARRALRIQPTDALKEA